MDPSLLQASLYGDVLHLRHLISTNPLLLDPFTLPMKHTTPLHVAALAGHDSFVSELLALKPQMGHVQNEQGMYPVHLAAAGGHWKTVEVMLRADRGLGRLVNREGMTAAHVAAACGRVEVLEGLVNFDGSFAYVRTDVEGENILHTGVRHNQLDAVKALARLRKGLLYSRNVSGNTVLHLAVSRGNKVIVNYLLKEITNLDVNTKNNQGYTALDLALQSDMGYVNSDLCQMMSYVGASRRRGPTTNGAGGQERLEERESREKKSFEEVQNTILIIATVIMADTFQSGIEQATSSDGFRFFNALSMGTSMALILFLAMENTLKHWLTTRLLLILLLISLSSMGIAYGEFILWKQVDEEKYRISMIATVFLICICCLLAVAFIYHLVLLVVHIVRKVARKMHKRKSNREHITNEVELRTRVQESPLIYNAANPLQY